MLHLRAPAKLNLYLRILGRRPDGYHEMETLFERIDLADELTFSPHSHGITLTCDEPSLDCGPENLITKAASLLQRTCGMTKGAAIHLRKRVPIAGGLGGGSSDAATTLIGLTRLWDLRMSPERLRQLAAELGSDVPFFLQPAAFAIGRGRGEVCEPLSGSLPELWQVLVAPPAQLSTKTVYEGFDRAGNAGEGLTERGASISMCVH
ncbi:MAG: 4-(cytidine 5'-diphospho)-2-C-methyl-D-erythritol kinase, partial [Candidatus Omnitrophica bacterium]|nr:4-(cytidine 5'-diphospho)-2-C-methyl-D-erythritol kinase [Candidatus Omnitrophota bacterium]